LIEAKTSGSRVSIIMFFIRVKNKRLPQLDLWLTLALEMQKDINLPNTRSIISQVSYQIFRLCHIILRKKYWVWQWHKLFTKNEMYDNLSNAILTYDLCMINFIPILLTRMIAFEILNAFLKTRERHMK
jgi:hypothetical protein